MEKGSARQEEAEDQKLIDDARSLGVRQPCMVVPSGASNELGGRPYPCFALWCTYTQYLRYVGALPVSG